MSTTIIYDEISHDESIFYGMEESFVNGLSEKILNEITTTDNLTILWFYGYKSCGKTKIAEGVASKLNMNVFTTHIGDDAIKKTLNRWSNNYLILIQADSTKWTKRNVLLLQGFIQDHKINPIIIESHDFPTDTIIMTGKEQCDFYSKVKVYDISPYQLNFKYAIMKEIGTVDPAILDRKKWEQHQRILKGEIVPVKNTKK